MTEQIKRVQIAVPTGELGNPVRGQLERSGLDFTVDEKRNLIEVRNMGVDMLRIRPGSVPYFVMSDKTRTKAGITGGDILWNAGLKEQGVSLSGIPNEGTLFIGVTKSLRERVMAESGREPSRDDLAGSMVVTKFPRIAKEVFADTVDILEMAGSTEAAQYAIYGCEGILDITAKGNAVRANQLHVVDKLMDPVDVRLIQQPGLSSFEERIIADFTGRLLETKQDKRYPVYA